MDYGPRKIDDLLDRWIMKKEVILIKGPRQSGKTTCLLHLKEKYGGEYVTLEDTDILKTFEEAPKQFGARYANKRTILYVDEVQYSKDAGRNLKLIYDLYGGSIKLVVTGSGSFDVKVKVGGYLVGRAIYFELLPLSFEEFLIWKARDLHRLFVEWRNGVVEFIKTGKENIGQPAFEKEIRSLLNEYLVFGGFPAIVKESDLETKQTLLKNLVRTYLEKDVFFFFNVREMEKFRSLLSYLSICIGSLLDLSSVMRDLRMDFRTLENYLSVLSNTYVIALIAPFHTNRLNELRKTRKLYFIDTGLRNAILQNHLPLEKRTDGGLLLENYVLNELRSMGFEPRYWRTTGKAEVDFVIEVNGRPIPIEVKTRGKEERAFPTFTKTYNPRVGLVFTDGQFGVKTLGKTKVLYLPHFFI
jgi:predicted AAA+ superfamily ATPase